MLDITVSKEIKEVLDGQGPMDMVGLEERQDILDQEETMDYLD